MYNIKLLDQNDNLEDYLELINQLSPTNLNKFELKKILENNKNIFILKDSNKIIGSITLLLEQKIIHDGKFVLHIEDLVIDKNYRGKKLASKLLDFAKSYAKIKNCYKIILDCDEKLENFYTKNNYLKKNIQMALYF